MLAIAFSLSIPAKGHAYTDIPIDIPEGKRIGGIFVHHQDGLARNSLILSAAIISGTVATVYAYNIYDGDIHITGNLNVMLF